MEERIVFKPPRIRLDDLEGLQAEQTDDPLGKFGTDPAHHARAEITSGALDRRRRGRLQRVGLELQAMRAIGEPQATAWTYSPAPIVGA